MKIKNISDLAKYTIPLVVLEDINKRITDWLAAGGKEDDSYIRQQLRYAEKFVR